MSDKPDDYVEPKRTPLANKQRMNPVERYRVADSKTPVLAISAFCYCCQGGSKEGDAVRMVQAAVRDCSQEDCPLWAHRGWQGMTSYGGAKTRSTTPSTPP